jgi:hypothetical protein
LLSIAFSLPLRAGSKGEQATPKPSTPLTDEEKEILKNREILEDMELLENLDKLLYMELFKENKPEEAKAKPESNKDARKKK